MNLNPVVGRVPVYSPGRPIKEVARELGLNPDGIIKLASNENPLGPSPLALRAVRRALRTLNLYPDGGSFYLKQKLAGRLGVTPANLIPGNGSNEILELLGHALLGPGSEVVVSQYCFAVYPIVAALFGARLVTVPAKNFGHDLPAMRAAITPRTRLLFVANPNNPTGTAVPPVELERFAANVPEHVVLAVDEAYVEFLNRAPNLLAAIRSGRHTNLILLRTFSKIYGLAGLRLGYGIGHPDFIAALEKLRQPFNLNALAQAAALGAIEDSGHVTKTRHSNKAGLKFFERAFRKEGWEYIPSSANFVLVRVGNGQGTFERLQRLGVIVRPMAGYGLPEWLRITVGTPRQNARCLAALQRALKK